MKYTVFTLGSRQHYVDAIHDQLEQSFWWQHCQTKAVDGRDDDALAHAIEVNKLHIARPDLRTGQLGIWCTVMNMLWDYAWGTNIVTFEDDAILHPNFNELFWLITSRLPRDTDAFSLFLPRDQDGVFSANYKELEVAPPICKAYQRYGGVSMLWTPRGADKFINLVERDGITDQWDDQLYKYAKSGEMNVYTQQPSNDILVSISGTEDSIVQESDPWIRE